MIIFGLTGGIASGKSSVARLFEGWGVPVVDADQVARHVVAPGSPALSEIVSAFGPAVLLEDGSLDRSRLGQVVFQDERQRALLNSIVHPWIKTQVEAEFFDLSRRGHELACYDIPLLFETKQQERYRPVVVVHASDDIRVERIIERDGLSREEALRRLAAQLPLEEKVARADLVIENNGDSAALERAAWAALEELRELVGVRAE